MKKLLPLILVLAYSLFSYGQTVDARYQDGKIWFKINAGTMANRLSRQNDSQLPLTHLPFLENINRQVAIKKLSRPFARAVTSAALQQTYQLEIANPAQVNEMLELLQQTGKIEYAEKVPLDKICLTPNDPSFSSQSALSIINASTAWNYYSAGSNVTIAIIDNGVDRTHSDLAANIWNNPAEIPGNNIDDDGNGYIDDVYGYDVADNDNNPSPPSSAFDHGTGVAGAASAVTNNNTGIASIGYSCKIMCVKATANNGSPGGITNGYDGLLYAALAGAKVINMSWGSAQASNTAQNIVAFAVSKNCILVAAAGNDGVNTQFYPAAYQGVISVAATNANDTKASFSNYGSWVNVSAPGVNMYTTKPGNTYGYFSGTSFASPVVAGLLGLMKSFNPVAPNADVVNCLLSTTTNINSQNPAYNNQLGTGRINAAAAMQCINATLSNPPVADFTVNDTTVTAGGRLTFTNLSYYGPTSWSWSFPGGSPATYNGATPPQITYATPGVYNVSLTVTNANGSNTKIRSAYITVTAAAGCLGVNFPPPAAWTGVNYYTGASVASDGWINGVNVYHDKQKAMYYDISTTPYTYMTHAYIAFGMGYSANPAKIVPVHVYDGTGGTPGSLLATSNLNMGTIMNDVNNAVYTDVVFSSPVVLPASGKFFVSVDLTNLCWNCTPKDTLAILSNSNGQTTPSVIWEQQSNNTWYQYTTAGSWNLAASLYIHPFLTNQPANAVITPSATTICAGQSITFSSAGSTAQDTLLWYLPGSASEVIPTTPQPFVLYATPGSYMAHLYVVGGGCSEYKEDSIAITVNAVPQITVVSSGNDVCEGVPVVLTAAGAASYSWVPASYLSANTGAIVTATPPVTTTYNVQGTNPAGCSASAVFELRVYPIVTPAINITADNNSICPGSQVQFTSTLQNEGTNPGFQWLVNGVAVSGGDSTFTTGNLNNGDVVSAVLTSSALCVTDLTDTSAGVAINVLPVPQSSIAQAICQGQTYTFGNQPLANAGNYTDTLVAANGCDSIITLTLTVNPLPTPAITQNADTLTTGSFDTYQWLLNGTPLTNDTANTLVATQSGTYTVAVTNANGCSATSPAAVVTINGISALANNLVSVYPNPSSGTFYITAENEITAPAIQGVYNALGQAVNFNTEKINSTTCQLKMPNAPAGIYFLRVFTQGKTTVIRLLIGR